MVVGGESEKKMDSAGGETGGRLRSLIEKATHSTDGDVDPRFMRAIKSLVRSSDADLRLAVETLIENMKKQHSQVRYLTFVIVDELFMRSKLFRSLLVVNFVEFLSLSVGFRRNSPLPPPEAIASRLRSRAIECLEKWNNSFGIYYRQVRLGFDYLKNTRHFQFPNQVETMAQVELERREREARSRELLLKKFETLKENFRSIKSKLETTIHELEECLEIVQVKEDEFECANSGIQEEAVQERRSLALLQLRNAALQEGEKIHESNENKAVFDVVRELHKVLLTRHLPLMQEWMSVLVRVDTPDVKLRDSLFKECIDTRNNIFSVKTKCEQLGCSLESTITEEVEEDIWEEGKIEAYDIDRSGEQSKHNDVAVDAEDSNSVKEKESKGKEICREENGSDSTSLKSKLLAEAPVMKWGSYLDDWGSNQDVLANQRGLELEGHWGRVDHDAVIPAEKIAELKFQATVYKEQHEEIRPCLAPIQKGGLCQRRDLRVCPFHGPIIPRDSEGNPINQEPESSDKAPQDAVLENTDSVLDGTEHLDFEKIAEKLARKAVKNMREQDQKMGRSLKRAKLAKVREHNEAVLRGAAVSSTSRSECLGESSGTMNSDESLTKRRKPTLASMLRKKVTTKDRIAIKLLTSRAAETAIRQARQGEEAAYRENFPNQW